MQKLPATYARLRWPKHLVDVLKKSVLVEVGAHGRRLKDGRGQEVIWLSYGWVAVAASYGGLLKKTSDAWLKNHSLLYVEVKTALGLESSAP